MGPKLPLKGGFQRSTAALDEATRVAPKLGYSGAFGSAERRRNRTYQPPGYDGLPVLKTGWGTSPVPLRYKG